MMGRRRGGLVRTVGRTAVIAGTATAVSGGVARRQSNKYAAKQEEAGAGQQAAYEQGLADAQAAPPPAAPAPAAPAPAAVGEDMVTQLERLGKLRDEGLLTDAEFEVQKAKVLAG